LYCSSLLQIYAYTHTRVFNCEQAGQFELGTKIEKFFSLEKIYAKRESDANGNFKQYSGTNIFIK